MAIYYPNIVKIHDIMNDGGRLGEITQIMKDIGEWAKVQSERILTTQFLNPEHEEANILKHRPHTIARKIVVVCGFFFLL